MKKIILALAMFICAKSLAQLPFTIEKRLDNHLQWLRSAHQNPPGYAELVQKLNSVETDLETTEIKAVTKQYPILKKIYSFLIYGLKAEPAIGDSLCKQLTEIYTDFNAIKKKGQVNSSALYRDYKRYGIDINLLNTFYTLNVCKANGVIRGTCDRVPDETPNETKEKANLKSPKQIENVHSGESFIELLHQAILTGSLSNVLDISEMAANDARIIPGQRGVPYEVKFKNAKTLELIYFEPGKYVIQDERDTKNDYFYDNYDIAFSDFSRLVIKVLNQYGGSSFEVFIQGSADKPTFSPKQLLPMYDTEAYTKIQVLKINKDFSITTEIIEIGDSYINIELPDLRAAFIRDMLLKKDGIKNLEHKINIIKGNVKPYDNEKKRNAAVYIYIDWTAAREYEKRK